MRVDDALVNFAHRRQVFVEAGAHGFRGESLASGIGRHLTRENLEMRGGRRQRVRLPVVFQLQAML